MRGKSHPWGVLFRINRLDPDWMMKMPVLFNVLLEERHTKALLSESLRAVQEWGMADKDRALTVKDVGGLNWRLDINCGAHQLQLRVMGQGHKPPHCQLPSVFGEFS